MAIWTDAECREVTVRVYRGTADRWTRTGPRVGDWTSSGTPAAATRRGDSVHLLRRESGCRRHRGADVGLERTESTRWSSRSLLDLGRSRQARRCRADHAVDGERPQAVGLQVAQQEGDRGEADHARRRSFPRSPDPTTGCRPRSGRVIRAAPKIAGIESRNENRAEASRPRPRAMPPAIVAPEREMPGRIATRLHRPHHQRVGHPDRHVVAMIDSRRSWIASARDQQQPRCRGAARPSTAAARRSPRRSPSGAGRRARRGRGRSPASPAGGAFARSPSAWLPRTARHVPPRIAARSRRK